MKHNTYDPLDDLEWTEDQLIVHFIRERCAQCSRKPSNACHIRPLDQGGETSYFNYIPLCIKHSHELFRIGTIEMMKKYANVCQYILDKGWTQTNTLYHPKLKGLL